MATTWGQYSWGDNAWSSATNIIPVSGQVATLTLGTDHVSTPDVGWSSNAWGHNSWGSNTNLIPVTGQLLSAVLDSATAFSSAGWGALNWSHGTWGSVNVGNILVTGMAMTISLGDEISKSSNGWGRESWGSGIWNGYGTLLPTGQEATLTVSNQFLINTEINSGWGGSSWGHTGWGAYGNAFLNGNALTATLSSVTIDNEINTGWSSDGWGVEAWGESLQVVTVTGQTMTAYEGSGGISFDGDSNLTLTGNPMTMTQGDETVNIKVGPIVSGFPMTMNMTYASPVVIPTSFALTAALGNEDAEFKTIAQVNAYSAGYWGYKSTWGYNTWGDGTTNTLVMSMQENFSGVDPAPDAEVTGNALAAALAAGNTFTITGDANIAPLANMNWGQGTWSESTWGDGLYRPDTDDIFSLVAALGTATLDANTIPTITGLTNLFAAVGTTTTVEANANVSPTGFGLTFSLGTGTNTLIWNAVDTGSAPVTPPGWKEVPTNAA